MSNLGACRRLLSAALGLPYWALPGSWVNDAGTEVSVDPIQVLGEGFGCRETVFGV